MAGDQVEHDHAVDLDVVIPVYNEGLNILRILRSLEVSVKSRFRVLVCYDRDDDDTLTALGTLTLPSLEIVLVRNRGIGAHGAVVTGLEASRAPAVVVMPADDFENARILDDMVQRQRQGADIVVPSRFMKGGRMVGCPWFKAALVRTSAFLLYHAAHVPTHDASNGFRLFSRRVVDLVPIESDRGFTYSIELLVKCHRLGWTVVEVPASWTERKTGTSRFRTAKWLPAYVRWCLYAFATTFLFQGPRTVRLRGPATRLVPVP